MELRYTNCKLNSDIVNSILSMDITSCQIDMLLWLSRKQDVFGRIFDIKYYEACADLNISHQEFYNSIDGLVCLRLIRVINRTNKYGWDIEILNNMNLKGESDEKRYLNTNRTFLYDRKFMDIKANEKKLILKVLLEKKDSSRFFLYTKTISDWLGIDNRQLIKSYMKTLNDFFNVDYSKNRELFTIQNGQVNTSYDIESEFFHHYSHKIKALGRKQKVNVSDNKVIQDIITLLHQYKAKVNIHILLTIILRTFEKYHEAIPKLINKSISIYIDKGVFI